MKFNKLFFRLPIICVFFVLQSCTGLVKNQKTVNGFIKEMVATHQFNEAALTELFNRVELKGDVIKKISKPSEGLPWYKYRKIFLTDARIKGGVKFWQENAEKLATVEQQYGVPAEIIVAILGVETLYGQHTGQYRVIDALSTLAFAYPPRSQFFRSELEQFLLLCREEKIDPLTPTGSYAGAMGMPQFMPSSYRHYAIDYNRDNKRDIWHDPDDVIASIANYFVQHKWQRGYPIAALVTETEEKQQLSPSLKQTLRMPELQSGSLKIQLPLISTTKAKIVAFEQEHGEESWAGLDNFYVITRYNHSPLYAMAVYQLSLAISNRRFASNYEQNHINTIPSSSQQLLQ
jgi:membrane-bound lytic murein transglycosylase B